MKRVILSVVVVGALAGAAVMLRAEDAVKVDAKHYTVAVFLTDAKGKFTFPDGKSEEFNRKAGDVIWNKATVHLPENTGDKDFDVVVIELKGKGKHSAK